MRMRRLLQVSLLSVSLVALGFHIPSTAQAQEDERSAGAKDASSSSDASGGSSDTYRELNLFGDVFERV